MPNFTFRCEKEHVVTDVFLPGLVPERSVCRAPGCEAPAKPIFNPQHMPQFQRRHRDRITGPEYREDLARFKGDPRAIVTGPSSLAKLIDTTRREVEDTGGIVRPLSEAAADSGDPYKEAEEADLVQDAYLDALQDLNDEEAE